MSMESTKLNDEKQPLLLKEFVQNTKTLRLKEEEQTIVELNEHLIPVCTAHELGHYQRHEVPSEKAPALKNSKLQAGLTHETRNMVYAVYIIAVLILFIAGTTEPMLLLYQQYVGFITPENIEFYVRTSVIDSATEVVGRAVMGVFAGLVGPPRAIAVWTVLIAMGLFGLAVSPPHKLGYLFSFTLFSLSRCTRDARTLMLTDNVPVHHRTAVMSFHALMTPIGLLFGPILWLVCDRFNADINLVGAFRLNKYTLNYLNASLLALITSFVASSFLRAPTDRADVIHERDSNNQNHRSSPSTRHRNQVINVVLSNGARYEVSVWRFQMRFFLFFLVLEFIVDGTMGVYWFAFQPILVNKFNATGQDLGLIFTALSIFALVPPLLIAFLSRYLKDRSIMLIGICIKLVGIFMLQPIFGPRVYEWQVVLGFTVLSKAGIFFYTTSTTLFTKILGGMSNGALLGFLSSFSCIGRVGTQFYLAEKALTYFGSFSYALFGLPILLVLALVCWPRFWEQLDPDREFNRVLCAEYEIARSRIDKV